MNRLQLPNSSGQTSRINHHTRIIVPNGVMRRPLTTSPYYYHYSVNENRRQMLLPNAPSHYQRYIVNRRPEDVYSMVQRPFISNTLRESLRNDRYNPSSTYNTSNTLSMRNNSRLAQASHRTSSPLIINVNVLAEEAEKAIDRCSITNNRQIWFESIMMTIGENMTVLEASNIIGVNRGLLFRLLNMVRMAMGFPHLEGTADKQFPSDSAESEEMSEQLPVRRAIGIVRTMEPTSILEPFQCPESMELSPSKRNESVRDTSVGESVEDTQQHMEFTLSSQGNQMDYDQHLMQSSSVNTEECMVMFNARMEMEKCEESMALEYASIVSTRTVMKEKQRSGFRGSYDDLKAFFKNLLIRHKQNASPSIVHTLSSFVADKMANFDEITAKSGIDRQLMRTMLRMALFERKLESAQINISHQMEKDIKNNGKEGMDEYRETSEEWLSDTVAELLVPINVTDICIVLDLAEKKKDRACLKALYRFVSPLLEKDPMKRVKMERLVIDGYKASSKVPKLHFKFWSTRMEAILTCILTEYPASLKRWKSFGDIRKSKNTVSSDQNRRQSKRIKTRESAVPDSMYLDKVFNRDLKRSFISFLRKLHSSGLPMSESTVISLGRKVFGQLEEKRNIRREAWIEWMVQGEMGSFLFNCLDDQ